MTKKTKEKEYRDLCIEAYQENSVFLGKVVLGASAVSMPLLINITSSSSYGVLDKGFLTIVMLIFVMSVYWSFSSIQKSKEGADASLSENAEEQERGTNLFEESDAIDRKRDIAFILGIFLLVLYLVFSNIVMPLFDFIEVSCEFEINKQKE